MIKLFAKVPALCMGGAAAAMLSGCVGVPYAGDGYVTNYDGYAEPYYGAPAVVAPSVSLGIYGDSYDRGPVYARPYPRGYYPRSRGDYYPPSRGEYFPPARGGFYPVPVPVPAPGYGGRPGRPAYGVQPDRPARPDRRDRPRRPAPGLYPTPSASAPPLPVPGARVPRVEVPEAAKDPFGRNSGSGH